MPETESRNNGDQEFWNHEMRESPVVDEIEINILFNVRVHIVEPVIIS